MDCISSPAASVKSCPSFRIAGFNTNFIIGPEGDIVLKYHKWHIPAYIGLGTSPHDLFTEYCEKIGGDIKDLFPVIDTSIGKLGTMTCHDGCTPEVSRALGYNGVGDHLPSRRHPGGRRRIRTLGFLDVHPARPGPR